MTLNYIPSIIVLFRNLYPSLWVDPFPEVGWEEKKEPKSPDSPELDSMGWSWLSPLFVIEYQIPPLQLIPFYE